MTMLFSVSSIVSTMTKKTVIWSRLADVTTEVRVLPRDVVSDSSRHSPSVGESVRSRSSKMRSMWSIT